MGLLDEAIREHLELKRRRGADPGEVARQEHEILGAGSDEPGPSSAVAAESADPVDKPEPTLDPTSRDEEPAFGEEALEAEPPGEEVWDDATAAAIERAPDSTTEFSLSDLEEAEEDEVEPDPGSAGREEPILAEERTVTLTIDEDEDEPDIVPADDEPDAEDILDQTPEFLEETPEHDRLWFEQRPPRDFDFGN